MRGSDLLNIDFTGGTSVTTVFENPPEGGIAKVREDIEKALPEATVQEVNSKEFAQGAGFKVVTSDSDRNHVEGELKKLFEGKLARYRVKVDSIESLSGPSVTPLPGSRSAVEPKLDLEAAPEALAAALGNDILGNDGITEELNDESCQETTAAPTATGTRPVTTATANAPAATATRPAATSTAAATGTRPAAAASPSPTAGTAPKPTATAAPSPTGTAAAAPTASPTSTAPVATVPAATAPAVAIPTTDLPLDEFNGGTLVKLTFDPPISYAKVEELTKQAAAEAGNIRYDVSAKGFDANSSAARPDWELRFVANQEQARAVTTRLETALASSPFFPSTEQVGAAVADGAKHQAVIAMLLSLLMILAYVWFRFQNVAFGVAAIAALAHDVLFTVGCLALSKWLAPLLGFALVDPFKIDLTVVAAILTIIGYSINDTIVIFDRIREVRGKSPTMSADLINTCLNQTLSRTILTSLTVFLVVVILYIWGGPGIHGFAFALVVGTISGTYSTIYVASPILLWFYRHPNAAAASAKGTASAAG
ncbi:MAG: protein translocase subunit SecF [Pirellulales bacterium]